MTLILGNFGNLKRRVLCLVSSCSGFVPSYLQSVLGPVIVYWVCFHCWDSLTNFLTWPLFDVVKNLCYCLLSPHDSHIFPLFFLFLNLPSSLKWSWIILSKATVKVYVGSFSGKLSNIRNCKFILPHVLGLHICKRYLKQVTFFR